MEITSIQQLLTSAGVMFGGGCIVLLFFVGMFAVFKEHNYNIKWYRSVSMLYFVAAAILFLLVKFLKASM